MPVHHSLPRALIQSAGCDTETSVRGSVSIAELPIARQAGLVIQFGGGHRGAVARPHLPPAAWVRRHHERAAGVIGAVDGRGPGAPRNHT